LPVLPHLAGARIILVSPEGPVARLPFAALPSGKRGYLVEEFAFATVPVPQMLPRLAEPFKAEAAPGLLLVGDVDFGASAGKPAKDRGIGKMVPKDARRLFDFVALPGTRHEMAGIARSYEARFKAKPTALGRDAATKQAFWDGAPGKGFIHLATHGFFAPSELRSALSPLDEPSRRTTFTHPGMLSGIALAGANREPKAGEDDGILTAAELAGLDLSAARLVVLSACETGLGDTAGGEGVLGLQRALHVAGARSAVTSLWKVPDAATQALMEEFYANLWTRKLPPLESLRQAQLALLRRYDPVEGKMGAPARKGTLSPYQWAAFSVSGAWR
ncbi:MAG: CHAT domain-containing protein, partial [Gemmataceae bacterium]|nr:CHAT domain-containing protein [Gemmataceae bacterium]